MRTAGAPSPDGARRRPPRPVLLLLAGLALMVVAWSVATPLGEAADERAHYVKALAAGRGDLRGDRPDLAGVHALGARVRRTPSGAGHDAQARALRFVAGATRSFTLPNRLVPELGCFGDLLVRADRRVPAHCVERPSPQPGVTGSYDTYVATYAPYVYLVPGVAMRAAGNDHARAAWWLGRAALGALCVALLGLALALLWDRAAGPLSLVGPMVATTPMSLWSFSVLNTSGLEIAAATCWTAALLRLLRRSPARPPGWVWSATGLAGAVLAVSRPSGPVFVVVVPLALALGVGARPLWRLARGAGRAGATAAGAVLVALVAMAYWQRFMPRTSLGVATLVDELRPAFGALPTTLHEAVGRFAGDYVVPVPVVVAWSALVVGLVVAAVRAADPRRRLGLVLLAGATIAFIGVYASAYFTSGFDRFYGRYALPGLVVVPLCAGAVLAERRAALSDRAAAGLAVAFAAGTAIIQLLVWGLEARRLAVGIDGGLFFPSGAAWSPPGGWLAWIAVVLIAAALQAASGVAGRREARAA